jgi:integrase
VSGHVELREGTRGGVFYLKYRVPSGRQVKRRLGPAWKGRGRPPAGYFTRRTADEALQELLADARRGTLAGMEIIDATFADAAAEWLRYVEHERDVKPSTLSDYRHMAARLCRDFGEVPLDAVTTQEIERWRAGLTCSNRTAHKYVIALNGIFKRAMRVYGLPANPVALVERPRFRHAVEIDVFSPNEIWALLRATPDPTLRALFMTAAFTGLRMGELLALRWRSVDFAAETIRVERSFTIGGESSPKSGRTRSVPMIRDVAAALARLGQREHFTSPDDLVFSGVVGGHLCSRALRSEYKAALARAELQQLRFHDLRHTFGTRAVEQADSILELKEWMGHAHVQTTMRYLHYKSKADAARRLAKAFTDDRPPEQEPRDQSPEKSREAPDASGPSTVPGDVANRTRTARQSARR